jgi:DNA-binding NtrC family response regulator
MPNALIVDDDPSTVLLLSSLFERHGFTTASAQTLAQARDSLDTHPDVCIVDLCLPDGRGTELLDSVDRGKTDFVMLTGHASVESSVDAMRRGACDYLTKPLSRDAFNRIVARFKPAAASITPPTEAGTQIVGESPAMRRLLHQIGRSDATVLIVGESGTGKELIAARLHELSPRAKGRYLALNCGAVSPNLIESELFGHEKGSFTGASRQHSGYFERAHGGTLFLDEVTEMPFDLQVRLLRVLETRRVTRVGSSESIPINVRVIAATNRDLSAEVAAGRFREDLYYRLHVFPISVPPLRERGSDVELLAQNFLERNCKRMGKAPLELTSDCLRRLRSYHWPGNVRELENVIERAVIIARENHLNLRDVLPLHNIPQAAERRCTEAAAPVPVVRTKGELREIERETLIRALEEAKWKVAGTQGAAAKLGIPPSTLTSRMKALQIKRPS